MSHIPFAQVREWTFGAALPFWAQHGVDREHGGFLEEITLDGAPTSCSFKRVRVICRQTYAFSHAAILGWSEGERLSRLGYEYLIEKARLPDGGWARRLSRSGDVIDARPDLYDIAFVLFALAWRYRLTGEPEVLRHANATLDILHERMRAKEGFFAILPDDGVRLQNPHMHLFEACLAAFEATQQERCLDQADELLGLFRRRLFDGRTLGERFTPDWRRTGEQVLEPGHHFEWVWILARYQQLKGADLVEEAQALAEFAERFGVDPSSQAVYDGVSPEGAPLRTSSRTWTNTERLKAWLALFELTGRDPRTEVSGTLRLLFDRYFAPAPRGSWVDQFDEQGRPLVSETPSSILYHILLAFAELLRLEPQLTALDRSPP